MEKIRVFLVDDHAVVRAQVADWLTREGQFVIVGQVGNSGEAAELAAATRPHVVLIDVVSHGEGKFEALNRIREALPSTPIVVLTAISDAALEVELRKKGVKAIFAKELRSEKLLSALSELAKETH